MKKFCAVAVFVALFMAVPAFGDGVNVGAGGSSNGIFSNPLFGLIDELGAQFTLSSATQINSVSVGISDFNNNPYSVAIVGNLNGPALWTSSVTSTDDPTFSPASLTLNAGTYFLVGPASGGSSLLAIWDGSDQRLDATGRRRWLRLLVQSVRPRLGQRHHQQPVAVRCRRHDHLG